MKSVKEQFVDKLSLKYDGEKHYPSSIVEIIREFEEENDVKFTKIYIGLGKDASWSDHGFLCYDYDCNASYEADELPEEFDNSMCVAGIWYDEKEDFVSVDFFQR